MRNDRTHHSLLNEGDVSFDDGECWHFISSLPISVSWIWPWLYLLARYLTKCQLLWWASHLRWWFRQQALSSVANGHNLLKRFQCRDLGRAVKWHQRQITVICYLPNQMCAFNLTAVITLSSMTNISGLLVNLLLRQNKTYLALNLPEFAFDRAAVFPSRSADVHG